MYELLKTQKNEVFKLLQDKGFETANFSWKQHTICEPIYQDPNIIVPRLEYLDGQYYFQFESHSCTFSPGVLELTELNEDIDTWLGKRHLVELWTIYLKREIEAPDLWTEMEKYKTSVSLAIPEQLLNEPIPATEVQEIASKLSLLTGKIKEQFELTDEQNQFVRGKLDYLAGAAK